MRSARREKEIVFFFLLAWFAGNLFFLTRFPLVHSDESWLAGLTRNMMESGSMGVTEPFFDLKPRYPHAIKILFHLLQMPFLLAFGYSAFSVRLLSLLFGAASLYLVFRISREMASFHISLAVTVLVSLDGQFLTAAHTARQEILLFCALLLLILVFLKGKGEVTARRAALLACITGLCVGLHPNSFLLAVGCGAAMVFLMLSRRRFVIKPLLVYIGVTGAFAACFVGISFLFDSQFPAHYSVYGDTEFGLAVPFAEKFREFLPYLQRLWLGVSGTYVLPKLQAHFLLFPALTVWAAIRAVRGKDGKLLVSLGMILGAVLGTVLIGRYNQLSAALWMLPCFLLLPPLLSRVPLRKAALIALTAVFAVSSALSFAPALAYSYEDYLLQISAYAAPGEKTLANLNAGFYFENGALLDIRNLSYLKENDLSFADYVKTRGIKVILWPEEMDFIYSRRPDFNAVYGNPRYVEEVEEYLKTDCTYLGEFENGGYAVRIVQELGKPYKVRAYRVNP